MSFCGEEVRWTEFYNRFGKIPVKINPSVLHSDEAIVAIWTHEVFEINRLREKFSSAGGSMRAEHLEGLVGLNRQGNLHDQAWDASDAAVLRMRGDQP